MRDLNFFKSNELVASIHAYIYPIRFNKNVVNIFLKGSIVGLGYLEESLKF